MTAFTGVNTLYNGLLHTPGFADLDFSQLKFCLGGGAAVQRAVSEKWKALTGRHIKEGYGLWRAKSYSSHKFERFPSLVICDALVTMNL